MNTILASGSPYRRQLLDRLNIPFTCLSPNIDETPLLDESPIDLARRLSLGKAKAVAKDHDDALIIASDQVAVLDDTLLGKPGSAEKACHQLQLASGKTATFLTGLCLLNHAQNLQTLDVIPFRVKFRTLSEEEILRYVEADQPLDCAGSFKWEKLGISLFERMEGDDPTALEGLPLITLSARLRELGRLIP